MSENPIISVLMPVYNCELFIYEAVQSILNQTFKDFELLVIDDCSTDNTIKIIESFNDKRIQLIRKKNNSGYTDSLNYGISIAKGNYIARMDGDDVSLPERFQIQVDFLDKYPDVILCGTGIKIINSDTILMHPSTHEEIKVKLCFSNSFYHPTLLFRKSVLLDINYDKDFEPAEDYDLWTKLIFKGKLSNINQVLLNYRVHPNQISNYKNEVQFNASTIAQLRMFQILFKDEVIDIELFKAAFKFSNLNKIKDFSTSLQFFKKIKNRNQEAKIYNTFLFNNKLNELKINFLKNYFTRNGFSIRYIHVYLMHINFYDFLKILSLRKRINKKIASIYKI